MSDFYNDSENRKFPQTIGEWVRAVSPHQIIAEMYRQYGDNNMKRILKETREIANTQYVTQVTKMNMTMRCGFRR